MISEAPAASPVDPSPHPACGLPAPGSPEESIAVILSDVTRLFWRRLECALKTAGYDFTAAEARTLVSIARLQGARQARRLQTRLWVARLRGRPVQERGAREGRAMRRIVCGGTVEGQSEGGGGCRRRTGGPTR